MIEGTPISGAPTIYTDANKSGKAGYKLENGNKVSESPYKSVRKSELYVMLMVWDLQESLNIGTDSQYAGSVVLHVQIAEIILHGTELTSVFIYLQHVTRNSSYLHKLGSIQFCQSLWCKVVMKLASY